MDDKTKKTDARPSKGFRDRMENFYFELKAPDGKTTKFGDKPPTGKTQK